MRCKWLSQLRPRRAGQRTPRLGSSWHSGPRRLCWSWPPFFFFSLPFKTEKVMQFEKVQTIRHCRELKFETTPRGAELSRAPPLPCSLPGRAALGPPEPRDRKQRLESRPLPAMALRMPTRAVGKVASGQATSGQVPLPGAPGVRPRPPLAESGPSLPASCSSWALSPSWGLCGESLTPDRPWCSCSQA